MIAVGTGLVTSLDNAAEICQTRSDTVALARAPATADQSVTLLEKVSLRREQSREQHEGQETEEGFVRVCVLVSVVQV